MQRLPFGLGGGIRGLIRVESSYPQDSMLLHTYFEIPRLNHIGRRDAVNQQHLGRTSPAGKPGIGAHLVTLLSLS